MVDAREHKEHTKEVSHEKLDALLGHQTHQTSLGGVRRECKKSTLTAVSLNAFTCNYGTVSYSDAEPPACSAQPVESIALSISGRERDIGDMFVRRVLPAAKCRSVGPFVFFDEMGPAVFAPGAGISVRPHPHINLATVTYLFEGEIMHRDSLGFAQLIQPGAVNWMTAGQGIVHSERTSAELRKSGSKLHGIQAWLALPKEAEEVEPSFAHHPANEFSTFQLGDTNARLIAGEGFGKKSPVSVLSPLCYADIVMEAGQSFVVPREYSERAMYLVSGEIQVGTSAFGARQMLVLADDTTPEVFAKARSRLMFLAGEPMAEPRHLWWNFVSSEKSRIEKAKTDWREGRFPVIPGDEEERIPLPTIP